MNERETAQLLARVSAVDNRIITPESLLAWYEILQPVEIQFAVEAVNEHFRISTDYLLPAHIISGARAAKNRWERDQRVRAAMEPRELPAPQDVPQCFHNLSLWACEPCRNELADA
jgi:hypothetical protein